jgi:hypothetical protein
MYKKPNDIMKNVICTKSISINKPFTSFTVPDMWEWKRMYELNFLKTEFLYILLFTFITDFTSLILTFAIGITTVLKAAKYSASPMGGARPPDHATFTLKPTPSPTPHCSNRKAKISVLYYSAACNTIT